MAAIDQGRVMKKFIVILLLSAIQSACSSQPRSADDAAVLLSFEQISAEISVLRESAEGGNDPIYAAGRGLATGQ